MVKNVTLLIVVALVTLGLPVKGSAEDRIELRTTTIKGNKELPKILYVVPWKDIKHSKEDEHKLELHSLFGDLFNPVLPQKSDTTTQAAAAK